VSHATAPAPAAERRPAAPLLAVAALMPILLAAVWIHRDALRAPFFADDYLFLDQARGRSVGATLAAHDPLGNYLRPVSRQLAFWTLGRAGGESPVAFHVAGLALLVLSLALLFVLVRSRLSTRGAAIATAFVALQHAADVPVLWASGLQDLMAVAGALAALALHTAGRRVAAAVVLLAALLSKETVALAPVVAVALDRRAGERWSSAARRAAPLFAAVAAWAALWLATGARRPTLGLDVRPEPWGPLAAVIHLFQTAAGLEWPHDGIARIFHAPPLVALALALAGIALAAWPRGADDLAPAAVPRPAVTGLVWALAGALPVAAVAGIWSAYYYLFALSGVGLALAAALARAPLPLVLAVVAALGWGAENARRLDEFATGRGAWTVQSHLNRFYLERGMHAAEVYLADLRRARPTLAPRTTLFFAGLPGSVAFQSADGPVVRWAYRDSSLHSYFLTAFTLAAARRGPVVFFRVDPDGVLREITGRDSLGSMGLSMLISDKLESARDMFTLAVEHDPRDVASRYALAWVRIGLGDVAGGEQALAATGARLDASSSPRIIPAFQAMSRGDTTGAIQTMMTAIVENGLDPGAHALLADLLLGAGPETGLAHLAGAVEAFASRVLAPEHPHSWRRWAMVQAMQDRHAEAAVSLERYFAIGGEEARRDEAMVQLRAELRRRMPGGDYAQAALRRSASGGR